MDVFICLLSKLSRTNMPFVLFSCLKIFFFVDRCPFHHRLFVFLSFVISTQSVDETYSMINGKEKGREPFLISIGCFIATDFDSKAHLKKKEKNTREYDIWMNQKRQVDRKNKKNQHNLCSKHFS